MTRVNSRNSETGWVLNVIVSSEHPSHLTSKVLAWNGARESADMLSQAVHDHYRCPNDFLNLVLTGKLSSKEGYFRFGPHATCYGRSCLPTPESDIEALASDLSKEVVVSDGRLTLPFDPTEIIDNLRLERYAENTGGVRGILRRMYYLVRPLTTRSLRKRVQQFEARNCLGDRLRRANNSRTKYVPETSQRSDEGSPRR
jgi:hypothetical protein